MEHTTSKKHQSFCTEPIGDKSISEIAGIGDVATKKLAEKDVNILTCIFFCFFLIFFFKFVFAYQLVGKYLQDKKDPQKMTIFLLENGKMKLNNIKSAVDCIKSYVDNYM